MEKVTDEEGFLDECLSQFLFTSEMIYKVSPLDPPPTVSCDESSTEF